MELALFFLAVIVITFLLLQHRRQQTPRIYAAAPEDNPCRPHAWTRLHNLLTPELAAEVSSLLQNDEQLKESLIGIVASNLVCKNCGYVSGTDISVNLTEFLEAVDGLVAEEKRKHLI